MNRENRGKKSVCEGCGGVGVEGVCRDVCRGNV